MKFSYTWGALWFGALLALSQLSHFDLGIHREVSLPLALMLSPYGILQYLLLTPDHFLRHSYFIPVVREGFADNHVAFAAAVALWIASVALLLRERRRRSRP